MTFPADCRLITLGYFHSLCEFIMNNPNISLAYTAANLTIFAFLKGGLIGKGLAILVVFWMTLVAAAYIGEAEGVLLLRVHEIYQCIQQLQPLWPPVGQEFNLGRNLW